MCSSDLYALARGVDVVVATGLFASAARRVAPSGGGPRLVAAETLAQAYPLLRAELRGDEVVLLKGSRGVALESLLPMLRADFGPDQGSSAGQGGH